MPKKNGEPTLAERNTNQGNLGQISERFRNYLCEFYPEDDRHMRILHMLERYPQMYRICYILHDKDIYSSDDIEKWQKNHPTEECPHKVGESKKMHIHCLITCKNAVTPSAMSKTLGGLYVKICKDVCNSLRYFLHDTPDSWDKWQYMPEQLNGDSKYRSMCSQRNSYYI